MYSELTRNHNIHRRITTEIRIEETCSMIMERKTRMDFAKIFEIALCEGLEAADTMTVAHVGEEQIEIAYLVLQQLLLQFLLRLHTLTLYYRIRFRFAVFTMTTLMRMRNLRPTRSRLTLFTTLRRPKRREQYKTT